VNQGYKDGYDVVEDEEADRFDPCSGDVRVLIRGWQTFQNHALAKLDYICSFICFS
jgi:hypothetical protein